MAHGIRLRRLAYVFVAVTGLVAAAMLGPADRAQGGHGAGDQGWRHGVQLRLRHGRAERWPDHPGFRRRAQRSPFNDRGRPGIGVYGDRPCNDHTGSFEVRDIRREGAQITRLWVVFKRWCSPSDVEFGELRLGYPRAAYDVSQRVLVWPRTTTYPGREANDVPILVRRTSAQALTAYVPSVSGPHAADFPMRTHTCSGELSRSGCVVWVGFTPSAPGPRMRD